MGRVLLKSLAILSVLGGCLSAVFHSDLLHWALELGRPWFSLDGEVSEAGIHNLSGSLYSASLVAIALVVSLYRIALLRCSPAEWFVTVFSDDPGSLKGLSGFRTLILVIGSVLLGVGVCFLLGNPDQSRLEDTWVENLQLVLLGISALILAMTSFRAVSLNLQYSRLAATFLGLLAAGALLVLMEEISWGQRILGWETPDSWSRVNAQNETNLHNLLNDLFSPLYLMFGLSFVLVTVASVIQRTRDLRNPLWQLLLPHPAFFFAAVVFTSFNSFPVLGALLPWGEFQEFLLYFCLLLYAWEKRQLIKAW
ncbi:MAG: hypothetical protein JSU96_20525 [Acidobacteriota bacterium]|nr:MAG: hypothetical protein JSU96_20525 [Acidobacteriota bacterium]